MSGERECTFESLCVMHVYIKCVSVLARENEKIRCVCVCVLHNVCARSSVYEREREREREREIYLTQVAASSRRDILVTPGRIVPFRGGVAISGSLISTVM